MNDRSMHICFISIDMNCVQSVNANLTYVLLNCSAQLFIFNLLTLLNLMIVYTYVCIYVFVHICTASADLNLFDGHEQYS